jgi:isoleucyl-tRNA synthetase
MSVLGPAFGSEASEVMNALNEASVTEQSLDALAAAVADALGREVELTEEMVEFVTNTPEGVEGTTFAVDGDDRGVVYVDTTLTEDIESEGYAREVVRRVQEMRKDLDLDLEAEVRVELNVADDRVAELVRRHEDLIAGEVRAREFGAVEDGHRKEWEVEGVTMTIAVEPVAAEAVSD